ncbi:glutathione S-transferase [Cristinia sonorae]|uniref:glutathione transferase n=1 Tax=Cristinia sonorae TaxID=1940300 RepID=A0A8K0UDW2_9AGAR|nr:glutathione S-transferase [Cristinia sonorae]
MVIQIYGIPSSTAVRRALIAFEELNVPYELVTIDLYKGEQKTEKSLKSHPFGRVPWINDPENDLLLFESRAIARYIVKKFDKDGTSGLIPKDSEEVKAAKFEQAASIEVTEFDSPGLALARELVFNRVLYQREPDEARAAKLLAQLNHTLDIYEKILSQQKYLSGADLTLADLFHLPLITVFNDRTNLDLINTGERPHVRRWWQEISSRPSWVAILALRNATEA